MNSSNLNMSIVDIILKHNFITLDQVANLNHSNMLKDVQYSTAKSSIDIIDFTKIPLQKLIEELSKKNFSEYFYSKLIQHKDIVTNIDVIDALLENGSTTVLDIFELYPEIAYSSLMDLIKRYPVHADDEEHSHIELTKKQQYIVEIITDYKYGADKYIDDKMCRIIIINNYTSSLYDIACDFEYDLEHRIHAIFKEVLNDANVIKLLLKTGDSTQLIYKYTTVSNMLDATKNHQDCVGYIVDMIALGNGDLQENLQILVDKKRLDILFKLSLRKHRYTVDIKLIQKFVDNHKQEIMQDNNIMKLSNNEYITLLNNIDINNIDMVLNEEFLSHFQLSWNNIPYKYVNKTVVIEHYINQIFFRQKLRIEFVLYILLNKENREKYITKLSTSDLVNIIHSNKMEPFLLDILLTNHSDIIRSLVDVNSLVGL